jgi:putative phosphoribosyl transferase
MARFVDRLDAGRFLARHLGSFAHRPDVLVLALPRGGVPVAFEVALVLGAPLDVFVVRKLGVPGREELAFGAIASGGARVVDPETVRRVGLTRETIEQIARAEERELTRRERLYRGTRSAPRITGRTAILVDDGLATGSSMRVAVEALRSESPARVVVAVPIAPPSTCAELAGEVDEIVCAATPDPFLSVGSWYEDFSQTSDDEVRELLERAARDRGTLRAGGAPPAATPS